MKIYQATLKGGNHSKALKYTETMGYDWPVIDGCEPWGYKVGTVQRNGWSIDVWYCPCDQCYRFVRVN